ncbi:hypothetical protein [Limibacterium fermenti]|uniref:hypothetical protein n=1 Tax=Limibacterium fermenti TaxID=3229863 RepID=UPI000E8D7211|nr:hypothetical protein [Porphyromonadaceae bacterium]
MTARKENLLKRIENVQRIVEENYEPGNQSKCKLQAFRRNVMPVYPMSERTFWRYMNTDVKDKNQSLKDDPRQLKLFNK